MWGILYLKHYGIFLGKLCGDVHLFPLFFISYSPSHTHTVVSHAREFLNEVCTDILLLKDKNIKRFKGNYDAYEQQK
jgi:hypothetical protein